MFVEHAHFGINGTARWWQTSNIRSSAKSIQFNQHDFPWWNDNRKNLRNHVTSALVQFRWRCQASRKNHYRNHYRFENLLILYKMNILATWQICTTTWWLRCYQPQQKSIICSIWEIFQKCFKGFCAAIGTIKTTRIRYWNCGYMSVTGCLLTGLLMSSKNVI